MNEEEIFYERRKKIIGRLLTRTSRGYQERVVKKIRERSGVHYKLGDNAVMIHLETKGNRISELARRSGLTKQALSQLVADLEKRGLVEKKKDPRDGRAFLVTFTEAGLALLEIGVQVVEDEDEAIVGVLGEERALALRASLLELAEFLDPEGF